MKLARLIFLIAGVYGVLLLTPALFLPPQGEPAFYYGFIGSALVWQFAFLAIARDPRRCRALMPICMLEKLAFFATCLALYFTSAMTIGPIFLGSMIDGVLMVSFAIAWFATKPQTA